MATYLTAKIQEGEDISLKEIILTCAREYGGLSHMRDEPMDEPIRYPHLSNHHKEYIKACQIRLFKAQNLDIEEARAFIKEKAALEKAQKAKNIKEKHALLERYESKLREIQAWKPPTPEHEGIKKSAIEHFEISIKLDCDITYDVRPGYYETVTAEDYIAHEIEHAKQSLERAEERLKDAQKEQAERAQWIDELTASL